MSKILFYVKYALQQLSGLSNPVSDAAVVGLVLKLIPSVHLDTATFVGILAGVGVVSRYALGRLNGLVTAAAAAYAANKAAKAK